jgi:hypothetical protein
MRRYPCYRNACARNRALSRNHGVALADRVTVAPRTHRASAPRIAQESCLTPSTFRNTSILLTHGSYEPRGVMSKPRAATSRVIVALLVPLFVAAVVTDLAAMILLLVVQPIVATVSRRAKGTGCNVRSSS